MKDKIIIGIAIITVIFMLTTTFIFLKNSKQNIKKLFTDETIYVCDKSKFSIIKLFMDENNKYIVEIKTVITSNKTGDFINKKYYAMRYPVEVNGNVLINTEKKFKITYGSNYLELTSDDKEKSDIYAGKYYSYKNEDKYYQLPAVDSGKYSGQYINKDKERANISITLNQGSNGREYTVSGVVKDGSDFYALLNETIRQSGEVYLSETNNPSISYAFKDNSLTINMFKVENGKYVSIDNVINGQYTKLDKILYKEMIEELDNSINLGDGVYGESY